MSLNIVRDDLCNAVADAVVLPSDERLSLSGGVSAQVARAAGLMRLRLACARLGECPTGRAVAVPAFKFPAKHLVLTVGPLWVDGGHGEEELLESAYRESLSLAEELGCTTVALPLISSGTFGFPKGKALSVAMAALRSYLAESDLDVTLYLYDREAFDAGEELLGRVASYIDDHYVGARPALAPEWPAQMSVGQSLAMPNTAPASGGRRGSGHSAPMPSFSYELEPRQSLDAVPDQAQEAVACFDEASEPRPQQRPFCLRCGAPLHVGDRFCSHCGASVSRSATVDLANILDDLDEPFSVTLMRLIDRSGKTDAQVYRRANMSRQLFSKIRGNAEYRPTKKTVLALCVALELDITDTRDLLSRAGFSLSRASKFDVIVEYFISFGNYDIFSINEVLFSYDQPLLG